MTVAEQARAAPEPVRRRLTPEARRALILDSAAALVARDGIATLSIETIARHSGISKSLVYNYFPNLTFLLQQLLQRELRELRRQQAEVADAAGSFEELIRSVTHVYLRYIDERGLLIERLQAEPSVSSGHDPTDFSRDKAVDYMATRLSARFGLSPEIARAATDISFGIPAAAGAYLLRGSMPRAEVEALTVAMLLGCLERLRAL